MSDAYLKVKDNGANGLAIVREESDVSVADLKNTIENHNAYDVGSENFTKSSSTSNGIVFTWNNNVCALTGTATSAAGNVLYNGPLFNGLHVGQKYYVKYTASDPSKVSLLIRFRETASASTWLKVYTFREDGSFEVPESAPYVNILLYVDSGTNMGSGVTISVLSIINALSNTELSVAAEELSNIQTELSDIQEYGVPAFSLNHNSATAHGIQFSWNNNVCTVSGTNDGVAESINIIRGIGSLPDGVNQGDYIVLLLDSTDERVQIGVAFGNSQNQYKYYYYSDDALVQIPDDCTQIGVRLRVNKNVSFTNPVTVSEASVLYYPKIFEYISNNGSDNRNVKMFSVGNSFATGAVWTNHQYSHMCSYQNSIYGRIAESLGIERMNVNHTMYSSTGLISPASSGAPTFLSVITSTDLSPYDYLLTQFNGTDLSGHTIGTINSTDNDGTLAGAVIHLANYIKTNNGLCRLILLSVPPYSSNPAYSGANVFSGKWPSGYSIDDLDNLMYKLAETYHFIYVSWQDLEISYHYMDYADYQQGDTTPRHASNEAVYRALGNYAGLQINAINSPIAVGKF